MKISIPMGFMGSEGKRQLFEKIFIRELDDKDYLIFKQGSKEYVWTIVDNDTLTNTERNMAPSDVMQIIKVWDKIIHRKDRCDLSLFTLGMRLLKRLLRKV